MTVFDHLLPLLSSAARMHLKRGVSKAEKLREAVEIQMVKNDPFACSLCGAYMNSADRVASPSDYCRDCRRQ